MILRGLGFFAVLFPRCIRFGLVGIGTDILLRRLLKVCKSSLDIWVTVLASDSGKPKAIALHSI